MKNLILILAFMFLPFALMAQDKTISVGGLAGMTNTDAVATDAAYTYIYKMNAAVPYLYTYSVALEDSTTGNTAVVAFAGSLDATNYKTILLNDSLS